MVLIHVCDSRFLFKGDIRLIDTNGVNRSEGIVDIFDGGTWKRVCGDYWDDRNAIVVCRQLGLKYVNLLTCLIWLMTCRNC